MPVRDLASGAASDTSSVAADLTKVGIALVDGLQPYVLRELADVLGVVIPHPDADPDGVTVIADRGATAPGWAGFSRAGLHPHTDRSGTTTPPGLLLTACQREPSTGGEALLVDGRAVYAELATTDPDALTAFCAQRTALFGGAEGYLGAVFTTSGNLTSIRLRQDRLARFAPGLTQHLPALRRAIAAHTHTAALVPGRGYVLNNRRWLHGRNPFTGPRVLHRITIQPHPGTVPAGFPAPIWPGHE